MQPLAALDPLLVAGATFLASLIGAELAVLLARRLEPRADERLRSQVGSLQGVVLGLVGLMLAFSFSMSVARFETRRELVLEEANAIGTTWLRTDALPDAARAEARDLLRKYVATRIAYYDADEYAPAIGAALREGEALHARLWTIAEGASVAAPGSLPLALLVAELNHVIDLHAARVIAHDARVPDAILVLQMCLAIVGVGTVAFGFGLFRGPHRAGALLLSLLLAGILVLILDLDHPRSGWIRVSQEAMERLAQGLDAP